MVVWGEKLTFRKKQYFCLYVNVLCVYVCVYLFERERGGEGVCVCVCYCDVNLMANRD